LQIAGPRDVQPAHPPAARKAAVEQSASGQIYQSKLEAKKEKLSAMKALTINLFWAWILLFWELIVFLMSIYMAVIYGTLYVTFGAFPIIFRGKRHWIQGVLGLAVLGLVVGMIRAVIYTLLDNERYRKTQQRHNGFAPPGARLPPA
jgi:hypothetical protein